MFHNRRLIFNIIYIPGTVAYQSLGLITLLNNSDLQFRLVGNALNDDESDLLEQISETSKRLSYINYQSNHLIPHGTLLDLLALAEPGPFLCFCDSDIFLFNELKEKEIRKHMRKKSVLSAGGRIENDNEVIYSGFKGGASRVSPDGQIELATSFFCIYKSQAIRTINQKYHVGFEQYRDKMQIPKQAYSVVDELELEFEMFDTGKLLSVLLHQEGHRKQYLDIEGLVHIGGMSGRYLLDLELDQTTHLDDKVLENAVQKQQGTLRARSNYDIAMKKICGQYFYCFLNYLINKGAKPTIELSNLEIMNTVKRLEKEMLNAVNQCVKNKTTASIWNLVRQ